MHLLIGSIFILILVTVEEAAASNSCASVYLVAPTIWGRSTFKPVFEVSYSVDESPFSVKGKLGMMDWGGLNVCGKSVVLRFRSIMDRNRVAEPIIKDFKKDYLLKIDGRENVYFRIGENEFREISESTGKEDVGKIENFVDDYNHNKANVIQNLPNGQKFTAGPMFIAGREWLDRRDYYYGKGSICVLEKSERCP